MRILFINDNLGTGGKERRIIELLKGIVNNPNMEVGLVLIDDRVDYKYIFDLDISVFIAGRKNKLDIGLFSKILTIIKNFNPDIIHIWSAMSVFYSFPSLMNKKYLILNSLIADSRTFRMSPMYQCITRLSYSISNCVISNSKAGLKSHNAPANSYCVYNGIDLNRFKQLKSKVILKNELKIKTNQVVVMVARHHKSKDYYTYISAAKIVLDKINDVTFLAVGDGELFQSFKSQVTQKYFPHIIFTGKRNDVESIVNMANIGVLCTNPNHHGEGISNSILEYMALKKPVIASRGGGTNELICNNFNGFLIRPLDPNALAEKLIELLKNKNLQTSFGLNGREIIEKNYTLQTMVQSYSKIYSKIVSNIQQ